MKMNVLLGCKLLYFHLHRGQYLARLFFCVVCRFTLGVMNYTLHMHRALAFYVRIHQERPRSLWSPRADIQGNFGLLKLYRGVYRLF